LDYWLFEHWLLDFLNHCVASSNFISKQAVLFTSSLPDLIIACSIVALWFSNSFIPARSFKVRCKVLLMFFAFVPTYILARLNQSIFHRPRPLISVPLELTPDLGLWNAQAHSSPWGSFPSDHAALFFIFNTIVFTINRKLGFFSLLFTVYCSLFRIGTGYQWPSDIIGGALLGSLVALLFLSMESLLKNVLKELILQFKRHPAIAYTISFLFLSDFAQDFQQLKMIASQLFNIRLFH